MNAIYLFSFRGIPVYVQLWYFLLLAFFCFGQDVQSGLVLAGCVTVSLLVHEFGHALVAAKYRLNPTVILHGWGGLCAHERAEKDTHDAFFFSAKAFLLCQSSHHKPYQEGKQLRGNYKRR